MFVRRSGAETSLAQNTKSETRNPKQIQIVGNGNCRGDISRHFRNRFPSPQPSPKGRGNSDGRLEQMGMACATPTDWRRFSLSLRERAGVRGILVLNLIKAKNSSIVTR